MNRRRLLLWFGLFVVFAAALPAVKSAPTAPASTSPATRRVSVATSGQEANHDSTFVALSADGRFVAFDSHASNLVPGDTNGEEDVFLHDLHTGRTSRVSVSSSGAQGNLASDQPAISADGRFIAFRSYADNLVAGDTARCSNSSDYDGEVSCADIFVHDRQTGQTVRVSLGAAGAQSNGLSAWPAISADGRYVAFSSQATNLVSGDTNAQLDIFVRDRAVGTTSRVSVSTAGVQGDKISSTPALSADGRFVVFATNAGNLFPGDTISSYDIALHDRQTKQTTRIPPNVTSDGHSYDPVISDDGRFVAFVSTARNLTPDDSDGQRDVFLYDRQTGQIACLSRGPNGEAADSQSNYPAMSADGRFVVFESMASNLTTGDSNGYRDSFRYDRLAGALERVSLTHAGGQATGNSNFPVLSADGQQVAFASSAADLVAGDANGANDIFVRSMAGYSVSGAITLSGGAPVPGVAVSAGSRRAVTGADGRYTFDNLPAGPLALTPGRPGFTFSPASVALTLPPDATVDFTAASPFAAADYFLGAATAGSVGGVAFDPADILAHDSDAGGWRMFFDASAAGVTRNVAAFAFDGADILLVFAANQSVAGVGTFTPWDVARFSPTVPGATTPGRFTWALDGSTVGLTTAAEKIDAVAVLPDRRLLVSTTGTAAVPGPGGATLKSQDEDAIAFANGGWSPAFDGSLVAGLAVEDVNGLGVDAAGNLYVTILGPFTIGGVAGDGKDVLRLAPSGSSYTVTRLWDGSAAPFPPQLDSLELGR